MAERRTVQRENNSLTTGQLAAVERARSITPIVSRSHRRAAGAASGWSFEPKIVLADDVDVVELLKRDQRTMRLAGGASE